MVGKYFCVLLTCVFSVLILKDAVWMYSLVLRSVVICGFGLWLVIVLLLWVT